MLGVLALSPEPETVTIVSKGHELKHRVDLKGPFFPRFGRKHCGSLCPNVAWMSLFNFNFPSVLSSLGFISIRKDLVEIAPFLRIVNWRTVAILA